MRLEEINSPVIELFCKNSKASPFIKMSGCLLKKCRYSFIPIPFFVFDMDQKINTTGHSFLMPT